MECGFCRLPREREAVTDSIRRPVGKDSIKLRRAPPAEEFSKRGNRIVPEGPGLQLEPLGLPQARSSDALVVRNSQNSPSLSWLTISAARMNLLASKASMPAEFLTDSRTLASTL